MYYNLELESRIFWYTDFGTPDRLKRSLTYLNRTRVVSTCDTSRECTDKRWTRWWRLSRYDWRGEGVVSTYDSSRECVDKDGRDGGDFVGVTGEKRGEEESDELSFCSYFWKYTRWR